MEIALEKIKKYSTIIIHRHCRPDGDAIGAQKALTKAIKDNFPDKMVYVVGDMNQYDLFGGMDQIEDNIYKDSLAIIVDCCVDRMISDSRYTTAKEVLIFDHHENTPNISYSHAVIDETMSSTCELLGKFFLENQWRISKEVATYLMCGIITDTGRFLYNTKDVYSYELSSKLLSFGADLDYIYAHLYVESLESKKRKNYFSNQFVFKESHFAYLLVDETIYNKMDVDFFTISRGMVNLAAGIKEIYAWATFTYEPGTKMYIAELRSRDIPLVEIAKKYGGGGHLYACGAPVGSLENVYKMIQDIEERIQEYENSKKNLE